MNAAIDARIVHYNRSGISRFARGLIGALSQAAPDFPITVYQSAKQRSPLAAAPGIKTRYLYTPPHSSWERATLPLEMKRGGHSFLHALDFYADAGRHMPLIAQIYDLYFLRDRSSLDPRSYSHYSRLKKLKPRIAHYICSSEATKKDAIELLDAGPQQTTVIYPGYTPLFAAAGEQTLLQTGQIQQRYGLRPGLILAVGTIEPRKNIGRLIQAYRILKGRNKTPLPQLVLAGRKGFKADEILASIGANGLDQDVLYLGEVDEPGLRALYSLAGVVAYVSLYEGFGFPLLEALEAGAALLTSNSSSMPEVAGQAALYVDPLDSEDIACGLERLLTDQALAERLRSFAKAAVERFPWQFCARRTLDIYRGFSGAAER